MKEQKRHGQETDLVIVGGGAAGMMAGILAARSGLCVSVLEKNRHFGKKLGITGNGKCNFTNVSQEPGDYRSDTPELAWDIVRRYPVSATLSFMEGIGIEPYRRGSGYYPASELAGDMTKALLLELERLSVTCRTNVSVNGILLDRNGFLVQTEGYAYPASCVLLATGGLAAPQYGTEGDGYRLAEGLGHTLIPLCPALTALKVGAHPLTRLAGLRRFGAIRLYESAFTAHPSVFYEEKGELQFTSYGISGIPAMQLSRYAAKALKRGAAVWAELDFCPEQSPAELRERIHKRSGVRAERSLSEWFAGWLPEKLCMVLLEAAGLEGKQTVAAVTREGWERLASSVKALRVPIEGVRSYDAAQTTAGGVALADCTEALESRWVPGLFFAGEVLDVDGACGGYNLQWAWSSAACAADGICQRLRHKTEQKESGA